VRGRGARLAGAGSEELAACSKDSLAASTSAPSKDASICIIALLRIMLRQLL